MKYQIGEVVRVRETGALVTVIGLDDDGLPIGYLTVADEKTAWYKESSLEPVNGGMPKPKEESTSDSLSLEQLLAKVRSLDADFFEQVCRAMEAESQRRDEQQQRQLAEAIVSAMEVYLRKVGDNRDFYTRGGEYMSMQDMHDAIIEEFDLTAQ